MKVMIPFDERRDFARYADYLERGFLDAYGPCVTVEHNTSMCLLPESIMPVGIIDEVRGRAYWDWSDFGDVNRGLDAPCGKIELRSGDESAVMQPTAQVIPEGLDEILALRESEWREPVRDVYFVGRNTNHEDRAALVETIRAQTHWTSCIKLVQRVDRPKIPPEIVGEKFKRAQNYVNQQESRVCIAPPGIGEKTWRHMETLALGRCLVMPETDCLWPADYTGCVAIVKRDWSDLPEVVDDLLADDDKRNRIASAGRKYWDEHLSPAALARQLYRLAFGKDRT